MDVFPPPPPHLPTSCRRSWSGWGPDTGVFIDTPGDSSVHLELRATSRGLAPALTHVQFVFASLTSGEDGYHIFTARLLGDSDGVFFLLLLFLSLLPHPVSSIFLH